SRVYPLGSWVSCRGYIFGYSADVIGLSLTTALEKLAGQVQIFRIDDIVSALHAVGLVAADLHADHLRDAGAAHVADSGAAQIVEFQIRNPCTFAGFIPRPSEVDDAFTVAVEDPWRVRPLRITLLLRHHKQIVHIAVEDRNSLGSGVF